MARQISDGEREIVAELEADAYVCGGCESGCEECAGRERTASMETIRRAVAKAERTRPAVLFLCDSFYAVQSASDAGRGYMVAFDAHGSPSCECPGYGRWGYCYHGAAAALRLGTLPTWATPTPDPKAEQTRREGSVLQTPTNLGRLAWWVG